VFNALPGAYLLLTPELLIEAASDDYLAATLTTREQLLGRFLFEAFPDNPAAPEAYATRNPRASLTQVLATGQPHQMAPQHYDVPDPAQPGAFVERYWLPTNRPVLDEGGHVSHLIHAVVDITGQRQAERALSASQAAEQAARDDAETQRQRLYQVLMSLPAQVAAYHGPEHVYTLVNQRYQDYFPTRTLLGCPVREAVPEAAGQGFFSRLDQVYATGEPAYGQELPVQLPGAGTGQPELMYINASYLPLRNAAGEVDGVLDFSYNVTEQVLARQQLQALNQDLEARVAARTRDLAAAHAEAEEQRRRLERLFGQAPAHINLFTGPDHVWSLVHPATQALLPTRRLLGLPHRLAVPELPQEQHVQFDHVYRTGETVHALETRRRLDRFTNGELHDEYFDVTFAPMFDSAGQIAGVMSFALNVTERVRSRQQAEALQAEVLAAAQRQVQERAAFHNVFEQTPALIALLRDSGHRFEYVNPAYQQLFPGRQLVGLDAAVAVPELLAQGYLALLDGVYRAGETFWGEELAFAPALPEGHEEPPRYYNFTYQAYREAGEIAGVSIFAYDVTEQVLARQEREAQRQRLHDLFMQAPAAICILDGPDLVYELVNPSYQALFPGRALHGRPLLDALPEIAGHAVHHTFRQVYETGVTHEEKSILVPLARPDGVLEDRYFNYIQQARRAPDGRLDGVLVFVFEVTEQVRARQASEAGARRLQLLTDALPVLISYIDHHQIYRFANRTYEDWFGRSAAEVVGRRPREIAGEVAYEQVRPYIERALAGERVEYEAHLAYRPDFRRHVRTTFIPDVQAGRVAGFYTLVTDVTAQVEAREQVDGLNQELAAINEELRATNEELLQTNTQLTRTNVDLDNFIYTASHDLKVPIVNIEGLLQALTRELPQAALVGDVPEMLLLMQQATERFGRTIGQLTDVSKLQQANSQPTTQVLLATVVEEVRLDLLPLLRQTQARLDVDVPPTARLPFSEKNLRSVVYNLLSNALTYRHPERAPYVQLTYYRQERYHVLRVQDNGLGLDVAKAAGKLFGMFQRLHTHVEGSGIGLYMVKKMVENSGGRIEVASQLGEGATFTVFIPVN